MVLYGSKSRFHAAEGYVQVPLKDVKEISFRDKDHSESCIACSDLETYAWNW